MTTYTISERQLSKFKPWFPCHGISPDVDHVTFEFDRSGDLVDVSIYDVDGKTLDGETCDGPASVALSQDAQTLADGGEVDWWRPWMNADDLKREFRASDSGDFYGNVMGWWFAISNEIELRGDSVPTEWHFSAGAGGPSREEGDYAAETVQECTDEALLTFGNVLSRAYDICKARGWDY